MSVWRTTFVLLLSWAVAPGCGLTLTDPENIPCTGPNCANTSTGSVAEPITPDTAAPSTSAGTLNPLCGAEPTELEQGSCVPDNPRDCSGYSAEDFLSSGVVSLDAGTNTFDVMTVPPIVEPRDASVPNMTPSDAGVADAGASDAGAEESQQPSGAAGSGNASGGGSTGGETLPEQEPDTMLGGDSTEFVVACRVRFENGEVSRACDLAGTGEDQSPCTSSRDCAPGLGCVGEEHAGRCLAYCCRGQESCGDTSFCTELPLLAPMPEGVSAPLVPVCAPAEGCDLDEPYPCPEGMSCTCGAGTLCTPVNNGLRSCQPPGTGLRGDECPCAPGHFCAAASQRCEKLCVDSDDCDGDSCGFSPGIEWGVCVGEDSR